MRLFLWKCLIISVASAALFSPQSSAAQVKCVSVGQTGNHTISAVEIKNRCTEPVTVTFFTAKGVEVVNVRAEENLTLTMLDFRRWRACSGLSNVNCDVPLNSWPSR